MNEGHLIHPEINNRQRGECSGRSVTVIDSLHFNNISIVQLKSSTRLCDGVLGRLSVDPPVVTNVTNVSPSNRVLIVSSESKYRGRQVGELS